VGGPPASPFPNRLHRAAPRGSSFTRAPKCRSTDMPISACAILGRIIANVTKAPYRTFVEQRLLTPLGMSATGFNVLAHPKEKRAIGYRWENDAWAEEPTMKDGAFDASAGGLEPSASRLCPMARLCPLRLAGARSGGRRSGQAWHCAAGDPRRERRRRVPPRAAAGGKGRCPGPYPMAWAGR